MLRISKLAVCLLALALLFTGISEETLIRQEDIVSDIARYNTEEVQLRAYEKISSGSVSEYYPIQHTVRYEGATARYVKTYVKRNDRIQVGDLIATFKVERDEITIARMQMNILRSEENYAVGVSDRLRAIEEKEKEIASAPDAFTREIKRLEREKLLISLEQYRYETENAIQDSKDALDELLDTYKNINVYSEIDGIVSDVTYFRDNEYVYSGTVLLKAYDPSKMLFKASDDRLVFRYNMPVEITVGSAKNRVTLQGRVVACPMAQPGKKGDTNAYIQITDYGTDEISSFSNASIRFREAYLENVLVINRKAITVSGGKHYIYKLSDTGMVSKRIVNYAFGNMGTGALVFEGVEPGEKLIID